MHHVKRNDLVNGEHLFFIRRRSAFASKCPVFERFKGMTNFGLLS